MEIIILGLGSNKGDSKAILAGAIGKLASFLTDVRISSLYITKPQEYLDQEDFHNMVIAGGYTDTPVSLLKTIQQIEKAYGRDPGNENPKRPRALHIYIPFFRRPQVRLSVPPLTVPHPAVHQRAFVLIPLLELYPNYTDPVTGEALAAVLATLPEQGVSKSGYRINKLT